MSGIDPSPQQQWFSQQRNQRNYEGEGTTVIKDQIVLKKGRPQTIGQINQHSNKLMYYRYYGMKGALHFIIDAMANWDNLMILVFRAITFVADDNYQLTWYFPLMLLILNIVVQGTFNFFKDNKLKKQCSNFNMRTVQKYCITDKRSKIFMSSTSASLLPGDIIKVREFEEFPADVLILDAISNDRKCYILGGSSDDFNIPSAKKSCEGTCNKTGMKMPANKFVEQITGILKFEYNQNNVFSGSFKPSNNPQSFNLTQENLAEKGSYLCQTKSVICMVLIVESQSMMTRNRNNSFSYFQPTKHPHHYDTLFYKPMRMFQVILMFVYFCSAFIAIFFVQLSSGSAEKKFITSVMMIQVEGSQADVNFIVQLIFALTSGIFLSLPFNFRLIMDSIEIMHQNFTEWDYNMVPAGLRINQAHVMKALGNISHVFMSTNAIMNRNVKQAKVIQIGGQWFNNLKEESFQTNESIQIEPTSLLLVQKAPKNDSKFRNYQFPLSKPQERIQTIPQLISGNNLPIRDAAYISTLPLSPKHVVKQSSGEDFMPNDAHFNHTFYNPNLKLDHQSDEMFKSIVICHQANRRNKPKSQTQGLYKSINSEEESHLMIAHGYGYQFINTQNKSLTIEISGKKERFDLMARHSFLVINNLITVTVIKPSFQDQGPAVLYAKGPMNLMLQFISDEQEINIYREDMIKYIQHGLLPTIYLKHDLTQEDASDLESKINDAMSLVKGQEKKIEQSLMFYIHNLKVLGVIGTQEIFSVRDTLVVQDLISNGIKVWCLSKEAEIENTINCNALRLLTNQTKPIIINGNAEKEVEDQIKSSLSKIAENGQNVTKQVLMMQGQALSIILRDDSLLKCLLTITQYCDLIIGSSINSSQSVQLIKHVKNFKIDGINSYILGIISSAQDQCIMQESDVSIVISTRYQKMSAIQINADIVMNSIYPLTYLLFKHGTKCNRRINKTVKLILQRTIFLALIFIYLFFMYSGSLPTHQLMLIMYLVLVSPMQIIIYGFSYQDTGFEYLHRIFGEYQRNFMKNLFSHLDIVEVFFMALVDSISFILFSNVQNSIILPSNGMTYSLEGSQVYFGISLYFIFFSQLVNTIETVTFYRVIYEVSTFISFVFVLNDDQLLGCRQFLWSPTALLFLTFVVLGCYVRNFFYDVLRKIAIPNSRQRYEFYTDIEDRIFLEEYEDSMQEFHLAQFKQDYKEILKMIAHRKITVINSQLMLLPRTESIDLLIESLNENYSGLSMKNFNGKQILNRVSLKFIDQNMEIEYLASRMHDIIFRFRYVLLITILYNCAQMIKEIILSSIGIVLFKSFWEYFVFCVIAIIVLIATKKFKSKFEQIHLALSFFLVFFYSLSYYFYVNVNFSLYLPIILYINTLNGANFRLMILLVISFTIFHVIIVKSTYDKTITEDHPNSQGHLISLVIITWTFVVVSWFLYTYWDEKERRLQFWQGYKKIKEFSKLKSILNILMPAFVRERIRQGQRYITDDQGEVTILFCDIADFDIIVEMFTGRELCEWLDNIYNAFDQLCEQNGLQKIETVGKTYMACAGLKLSEKKVDQRLLIRHHSVRVADFSQNILNFIKKQSLKDGSQVKVKIGIHSGNVISGVVGDNKPQFSLIGDSVNKASRVCSKCKDNQIMISKQTFKLLESHSNMFQYDQQTVDMKGIGREHVFYLRKMSAPQVLTQIKQNYQGNVTSQENQRLEERKREKSDFREGPPNTNDLRLSSIKQNKVVPQLPMREDFGILNFASGDNQPQTSRSLIQSNIENGTDNFEEFEQSVNETNGGQNEEDDSFSKQHNFLISGDFKDDRTIFKSPVQNQDYDLVERPPYLLNFNLAHGQNEQNFRMKMYLENQWKQFVFIGLLGVFNKLANIYFTLELENEFLKQWLERSLYIILAIIVTFEVVLICSLKFLSLATAKRTQIISITYIIMLQWMICAQGQNYNSDNIQAYDMESMLLICFVYFLGMFQFRQVLAIFISTFVIWNIKIFALSANWKPTFYSLLIDQYYFLAILTVLCFQKEMLARRIHNRKIIIDFEIKRTTDLLSNLLLPHVLQGIKNDQKVVDELEDVTLLFTDMVGFTQFCNNVQNPKEVLKLLSELFSRFDQLCVQNNVYKVHTIGDCYVIMGYSGNIPLKERTDEIKAQEAYQVVKTAFEMIQIIDDVREHTDNSDLKDLNMRIGIHTGKIVAGIIGTKIVSYDIFGVNVLIANKMESHGIAGQVVVSEDTKHLLNDYSQLDFCQHKIIKLQGINRTVESFIVAPRQPEVSIEEEFKVNESEIIEEEEGKAGFESVSNSLTERQ